MSFERIEIVFLCAVNRLLNTFPPGSCAESSSGIDKLRWGYELLTLCLFLLVKAKFTFGTVVGNPPKCDCVEKLKLVQVYMETH